MLNFYRFLGYKRLQQAIETLLSSCGHKFHQHHSRWINLPVRDLLVFFGKPGTPITFVNDKWICTHHLKSIKWKCLEAAFSKWSDLHIQPSNFNFQKPSPSSIFFRSRLWLCLKPSPQIGKWLSPQPESSVWSLFMQSWSRSETKLKEEINTFLTV